MAKKFSLEIVTPDEVIMDDEADSLVLPAFNGSLGVLYGHAPALFQLVKGKIKILSDQKKSFLSITGGFAEITHEKTSLFIESCGTLK